MKNRKTTITMTSCILIGHFKYNELTTTEIEMLNNGGDRLKGYNTYQIIVDSTIKYGIRLIIGNFFNLYSIKKVEDNIPVFIYSQDEYDKRLQELRDEKLKEILK